MYSFSYLEPNCCSMSSSHCCFLTCIQISQEASQVVWYSHLFQNLPQFIVIHTVKGFGIVNKAEIDVFLELSCCFDDPVDVGNLISGFSAFSKASLNIWKFMVHVLLKPGLENFEHYPTSMWHECNCAVLSIFWHCLSLGLEWKLTFSHDHTKFQSREFGTWNPLYAPKAKKINKSGPFKGLVTRRCHKPRITINTILGTWSTHTHTHTHTHVYKHIYLIYARTLNTSSCYT